MRRYYYGRGKDRALQTEKHLDRSAIAMWALDQEGQVQTLMDWVKLS